MNILFCKSNTIGGWIIRLFTFSRWNHVAVEVNGWIFDATLHHGVEIWTPGEFELDYKEVETVEVGGADALEAETFLLDQIGKKYDPMALVALPFRTNWQAPNRWFCSELAAAALVAGGRKMRLPAWRVTPRDLWVSL